MKHSNVITRRGLIQGGVAGAALVSSLSFTRMAHAQAGVIKIGFVSPKTGALAGFSESDDYIIKGINAVFSEGITIDGKTYGVEVIVKDSQSNPNRAADVAAQLILEDEVNLMVVASTPETTNPVSDQCEINGVPCISTVAPWQPWFFGRGGVPENGFEYTYHFFMGIEDVISNFTAMWNALDTNKSVGGLFPNDADGNAWGDPELGFPKPLAAQGFSLTDTGRFQNMTDDFSSQISAFKNANTEIVTGVMIPPDLTTFWNQAKQQGFKPKAATIGKALLFPQTVESLGDAGHNMSTEVWWTPKHPFSSSLTGSSAKQVADGYTEATGRQWTQPIGFAHALFEVAADALKRSGDPMDYDRVRDALAETDINTVVGPVNFQNGPVPNVSKTPVVGGQWRLGGDFKYEMIIVSNLDAPSIPLGGTMEAL
ncbi:MAG: ABC transporter substrate-binding protein [Gammaproteobacteria bacterium]|nr:ABC transporter substrate-binding protein [Gammaproteobacteria bacterium]